MQNWRLLRPGYSLGPGTDCGLCRLAWSGISDYLSSAAVDANITDADFDVLHGVVDPIGVPVIDCGRLSETRTSKRRRLFREWMSIRMGAGTK